MRHFIYWPTASRVKVKSTCCKLATSAWDFSVAVVFHSLGEGPGLDGQQRPIRAVSLHSGSPQHNHLPWSPRASPHLSVTPSCPPGWQCYGSADVIPAAFIILTLSAERESKTHTGPTSTRSQATQVDKIKAQMWPVNKHDNGANFHTVLLPLVPRRHFHMLLNLSSILCAQLLKLCSNLMESSTLNLLCSCIFIKHGFAPRCRQRPCRPPAVTEFNTMLHWVEDCTLTGCRVSSVVQAVKHVHARRPLCTRSRDTLMNPQYISTRV